jgi:hypothetical protein
MPGYNFLVLKKKLDGWTIGQLDSQREVLNWNLEPWNPGTLEPWNN